ncbi:MAG: TfoX/Sxy family protein [Candidatus Kapaibacterium sp.]|jgi:TfoX/Sxy family transcriptional regulator of competence genes
MPYNLIVADRIRTALSQQPSVEEKKMFRGIAFMVNGKLCISVGAAESMFRIDPLVHDKAVEREGCRTMIMKGREYKGYVNVHEDAITSKKDFDYWIGLAIDFNKRAKVSPKKKKKVD